MARIRIALLLFLLLVAGGVLVYQKFKEKEEQRIREAIGAEGTVGPPSETRLSLTLAVSRVDVRRG